MGCYTGSCTINSALAGYRDLFSSPPQRALVDAHVPLLLMDFHGLTGGAQAYTYNFQLPASPELDKTVFAMDPAELDPRALSDFGEWFAESMAQNNFEWAKGNLEAGAHDGSLIGQAAAHMRKLWLGTERLFTGERPDGLQEQFRGFLQRGHEM